MLRVSLMVGAVFLVSPALAQSSQLDASSSAVPLKPAELRAEQLDALFALLHQPGTVGGPVEQQIWQLWNSSDSPTAEALLQQSERAIAAQAPVEALAILDRLTGAYPDFAEAWNKRATLYFILDRYDASLRDIEKVLDLEPRHFGALTGKGMILMRQKKYAEARAAYEEALAVNPTLQGAEEAINAIDRIEQGI
ncbi:tetratricopeptide repeat protein [Aestuariivirga sp.]|jgi:tetratricopeptide (TPR) repeat protein|uniref:tetratricopeptide repeat protein n=1 Tax=Aestuariivirga sp. TaxID=2650926 RepID=UPI0037838FCE